MNVIRMNNIRPQIVLLRGASAAGKTAVAKSLLLYLKDNLKKNCAFISEDNFRKKMQFNCKAEDKKVHLNSVKLITRIIKELSSLGNYEVIVIEGLFRYKEMINEYKSFAKRSKYNLQIFQLVAPLELRRKRNRISSVRDHISNLDSEHGRGKGEEVPIKDSVVINTVETIDTSVKLIASYLEQKSFQKL